jgi:hypothetical protein
VKVLDKVSGIKDGRGPSDKVVEYEYRYEVPGIDPKVWRYVYSRVIAKVGLTRYDDGWRIE